MAAVVIGTDYDLTIASMIRIHHIYKAMYVEFRIWVQIAGTN